MEHENLMKNIENLIERELENARSRFSNINSSHEGYAVILEEFEEFQEEVVGFEESMKALWKGIKSNDENTQYESIKLMEIISKQIIKECIQVGAMCKRFHEDVVDK